jgi:serine/threonine protein kinase
MKMVVFPVLNLKVFPYKELHLATRGFSEKIGHGGFGTVFQAELLGSSTCVAVKRLERPGGGEREFRAVVCTIGNIQHLNLVRLKSFSLSSNGVYFSINVYNTETTVFWENKSEPSIFLQQMCCSFKLQH